MQNIFRDLIHDLSFGARSFSKTSGFTLVNVLTLAVAIGATTTIWSAVQTTIINPLPVKDSDRLMTIESKNSREGRRFVGVNPVTIAEMRRHPETFGDFTIHSRVGAKYRGGDYTEIIPGASVTPDFFSLWGVQPLKGRVFAPNENSPDNEGVVVVSHAFWRSHLNGDPDVVGRTIELDGGTLESPHQNYKIIGVMPSHFIFPNSHTHFWMPAADPQVRAAENDRHGSRFVLRNYIVTFRLPDNASTEQAQAILDAIRAREALESSSLNNNADWNMEAVPAASFFADEGVHTLLWILAAVIGLVWLIACANVAYLLIARSETRLHEMAMRVALGAGRGRLIRQMLTESLMLAAIGGGLGLFLTHWGLLALEKILIGVRLKSLAMDWPVFVSTAAIAAATGLVFGLLPAWRASRPGLTETLKQSGTAATQSGASRWFVNMLIGGQIALAVVLLVGSGLLIRSAVNALRVDVGYVKENLVRVNAMAPFDKYGNDSAAFRTFVFKLTHEMAALPGVESLGTLISGGTNKMVPSGVDGKPSPVNVFSEGCGVGDENPFVALGIPLIAGRFLDHSDAPRSTVVINQALARAMWPGQNALGRHFRPAPAEDAAQHVYQVVGIVGDARLFEFTGEVQPTMYRPADASLSIYSSLWIYLRTTAEVSSMIPGIHQAITRTEPEIISRIVQVMPDEIRQQAQGRRFFALYLALYGGVGLILAAIGLYALMAFRVQRRTREIGVRMALGATGRQILGLTMREGLKVTAAGGAIGMGLTLAGARLLETVLFGVEPVDPPTLAGVALTILLVAAFACFLPARQATKIDPMAALRIE